MDNFDLKKYLAEGKLFEEAKTIDVYGDGDVVVDISKATPEQERVINFEFEVSEFSNSEEAQEVVDQIMNLNSAKEVKNYYDNVRGWATVDYLDTYKALNAFVGNKPIAEGRLLKEDSEDIAEMAYERDSVEDIVKRIKPILANHPQLKKQEDPEQYLIDFVTKRKRFINKNEAPIGKDKFAYNVGTMPYDKYINLQFNEYIYSTTP